MSEYGESIKFHLVDIKKIESEVARSTFDEPELEELADLILVTSCLLKPLILEEISSLNYKVLEGHFEYHAAVRANEKDTKRSLGGMVSAFVVTSDIETTALAQVKALSKTVPTIIAKTENVLTTDNTLGRINNYNVETQLAYVLQEVIEIKQLQLQMPKRLEPLEALNTLDVDKLLMGLKIVGARKVQETAQKIDKERKKSAFTDLQDVINRKVGITANTMIKIVDTWSRVGFFF